MDRDGDLPLGVDGEICVGPVERVRDGVDIMRRVALGTKHRHISQLLSMPHTRAVVILGAGWSIPAGLPSAGLLHAYSSGCGAIAFSRICAEGAGMPSRPPAQLPERAELETGSRIFRTVRLINKQHRE